MNNRSSHGVLVLGLSAVALVGAGAWVATRQDRSRNRGRYGPNISSLAEDGLRVERTMTILRSPGELYLEWRDLTRWPDLVPMLESVARHDDRLSHWVARGPANTRIEWDAELVADEPGQLIAWRSVEGSDVSNAGSVHFETAPGGRGTEVRVALTYTPPAGRLGAAMATIFGKSADRQVREGLRRFKQRMETHEIAVSGAPESSESTPVRRVA
jgi:uncharacterized membrane protein